jgi:hypothetical protein
VLKAEDPEGRARLLIALPPELAERTVWAEVATAFLPQPGDEVVVAFEAADPRRPYVVGMLWHGSDRPPEASHPPRPYRRPRLLSYAASFASSVRARLRERL